MAQERLHNPVPVHVAMSEWKVAQVGSLLYTEGLGPCIGVAIIDISKHVAALGHFPTPSYYSDSLSKMIATFVAKCSQDTVQAYVRGGCRGLSTEDAEDIEKDRTVVLNSILAAGLKESQIDVTWNQNKDESVDMSIDPRTGEFKAEVTSYIYDYDEDDFPF